MRGHKKKDSKKYTVTKGSIDLSKEFNQFVKENKKLLKALSD